MIKNLFDVPPNQPAREVAPWLPINRTEMDQLGWDQCDIILVTGDAYVDHPSFGMAIIGRLLEAHGFRVGIISQPDWQSPDDFQELGAPALFFGVTSGNMDSMVNRYTSEKRIRSDDAYSPDGEGNRRPDRAVIVYSNRCREAFPGVQIVLGGIEASLRRVAHFDYWSEKIRRSILMDSKADILVFGNGERPIVEIAHRAAAGEFIREMTGIPGTAVNVKTALSGAVHLPSFEALQADPMLLSSMSRTIRIHTNPACETPLEQPHGDRIVRVYPPAAPLSTAELDGLYELPYARNPHPSYGESPIPAFNMIRFSVTAMRGCFGGCAFCSITEHEGRIIQSRSEASILREIDAIQKLTSGFAGTITDIGGPTANMYRMGCKSPEIQARCKKFSCLFPTICTHLKTDHTALIKLYQRVREHPGIKHVFISSGVRHDLALRSQPYIENLARYHVSGLLKLAPEHSAAGPLNAMMKPHASLFLDFKKRFNIISWKSAKKQFIIPYFMGAHPGTTDLDMLELALWMKHHNVHSDQVQTYLPLPMTLSTAMYLTGRHPAKPKSTEPIPVPKGLTTRRLHKALLRWHDPDNHPLIKSFLNSIHREDLIGIAPGCLIPRHPEDRPGLRPLRPTRFIRPIQPGQSELRKTPSNEIPDSRPERNRHPDRDSQMNWPYSPRKSSPFRPGNRKRKAHQDRSERPERSDYSDRKSRPERPHTPRQDRPYRPENRDRSDRYERSERPGFPDRKTRPERPHTPRQDRPYRPENRDRSDRYERSERPGFPGRKTRPERPHTPRQDRPYRPENRDRNDRYERSERPGFPDRKTRPERSYAPRQDRPYRPENRDRNDRYERTEKQNRTDRPKKRPKRRKP